MKTAIHEPGRRNEVERRERGTLGQRQRPPANARKWAIRSGCWHITSMQESDSITLASLVTRPREGQGRAVTSLEQAPLDGELAFMSAEAQVQRTTELLGAGALVVAVPSPAASLRGKLAEHLDETIERALGVRGAPSPYLASWCSMPAEAHARIADQLFRARTVGASGIAVALGSLARIAAPTLTPEDSAALRTLAHATQSSPLAVLIDDSDTGLGGYSEPIALDVMLRKARPAARELDSREGIAADTEREPRGPEPSEPLELTQTAVDAPVAEKPQHGLSTVVAPPPPIEVIEKGARDAARRRATAGVPVSGPTDFWRSWAIALSAARGRQPLAAFERLFVDSYMPLANAIAQGLDDARARSAHDEFRDGFERTYADAFAAFGATGRRPRMVMDAFDVAFKQARLHNARATQVLVVDALRHDIGCVVRNQLAKRAAGTVSLTSESLLWSALPTTTYRQLETLARGMDALRAPASEEGADSLRGRTAETVRRMRVGSRELYKLDLVPSMLGALPDASLGEGPAPVIAAITEIGMSVTDAVLRHVETLTPRTLLLLIGDHGFTVDRRGQITHGGSTPEEVLVPCLAYLVGDLH